ncbi:MAG: hypothetical protein EZS28_015030 [Streblomastix strix]|uniref:Tyr recombinase domain-containing protein n=1 Tax=Streblomastix strix TaxID=222440 RepID=A0A5J4W401_9EUKA|nr:MAG: hypothetical protein EZS28_015030 [Streblomastix strix]
MGVFDDWMKEKSYTIEDIMNKKIPLTCTEFMIWITKSKKTKPFSAKHNASILNTMLSVIFGTVQVSATAQRLTTHAISNHWINNPRYMSTQDIYQLFEYCRERPESNLLSNEKSQIKLASLLISLCLVRIEEMENIDQSTQIIDDEKHRATVCIPPKQSRKKERYNVRRTENPRVCPTEAFFVWLVRLREHFQQSPTNFILLFWTEKWEQADQRYIGTRFERLVQTLVVQNATANSIRHASSSELAAQGFDGRTINVFTHHTSDSKMNKKFYIFAINREQDSIASALVKNHSEKQATQIIIKYKGVEQESPQEMDYNNLLQEMICSYLHRRFLLHLFPPNHFDPIHR